ncbi:hypothetical protein Dda_8673 [Drechslerella dactyloides]|uniref:Uncharacterized protein n=1 Tax=Drechslerella dactyloides TaxID=74499 RepID=A0AAD6IQR7_DREDA|nr:hypothetical protein Dda_8673 [Drechslerella dactyloides]
MVNPFLYAAQVSLLLALSRGITAHPIARSTVWETVTVTTCKNACVPHPTSSSVTSVTSGCDDTTTSEVTTTSTSETSTTSSSPTCTSSPPPNNDDFRKRNYDTIHRIYNLTIFPNQVPIITYGGAAVPDGLFANDTSGRISPVGNFTDFEDSIEYFFALPPIPQSNKNNAAFSRFELAQFSSECPEVAASTVYLYTSVVNPGGPDDGKLITILRQTGFWKFNAKGEVENYDLDLIEIDHFISELTSTDYDTPEAQAELIATTCMTQALRCVGPYQEYESIEQCIDVLTNQKKFGSFTNIWSDSVVCRSIHLVLTITRPAAHCPHVGPSGGMKCVDYPYLVREFDDERLWGRTDLFRCPGVPAY